MLVPGMAWLVLLVGAPLGVMLFFSFMQVVDGRNVANLTIDNYRQVLSEPFYMRLILQTVVTAILVATVAVVLAFPLAYAVASANTKVRAQLVVLVLVPLWVSYLLRVFAWQTLLGQRGIVNSLLMYVGVVDEPIGALLYSRFSVWIALLHISLPFVFVPILVALERIPPSLLDAARDLGATRRAAFWRVILRLSMPGIVVGFAFAFIETLGDYVTPILLGGTDGVLIGRVVVSQFGIAFNWPLGAAMAFVVLTIALLVIAGVLRFGSEEAIFE
jgi:spermidine/putrescine transport system permease protein